MVFDKKYLSQSPAETESLGRELCRSFFSENREKPLIILLTGELGAGKSVFVRGALKSLGVSDRVTSPTFTLVKNYPLEKGIMVYHLDLYRVIGGFDLTELGIDDLLINPKYLVFIEWPERLNSQPAGAVMVKITGTGVREITVFQKNRKKL